MNKKQNKRRMNQMYSWGHERRVNLASNHTKKEFGGRLQKVTIDAGFTCPNRDGTVALGGCTYCNNDAFNPSYCQPVKSVTQQINEGLAFHKNRYKRASNYVAYFQAYSNTYGSVKHLRKLYYEALAAEGVIGLVIGTRPDCVDGPIFDLLEEINQKYYLIMEFGIESVYNETLDRINRGHYFEKSIWAVNEAHRRGIKTGAHFIFGLPGETKELMMDSARIIAKLPLHSAKFHQLQIVKGTLIGKEYQEDPNRFKLFDLEEYLDFISEFVSYLPPELIIERLAGEVTPKYNLTKGWNLRYDQVLQKIEKRMAELDLWQGKNYVKD